MSDPCEPMNCSLPGSSPWNSPGKNTGAGCHFLLQGNFPTQKLNPGLLHCRLTLYRLSYTGSLSRSLFKEDLLSPLTKSATNFKYLWQETRFASLSGLLHILINTKEKDRPHYTNSGLLFTVWLLSTVFTCYCIIRRNKNCHIKQNKQIDETKKKDCAKDDGKGSLEKAASDSQIKRKFSLILKSVLHCEEKILLYQASAEPMQNMPGDFLEPILNLLSRLLLTYLFFQCLDAGKRAARYSTIPLIWYFSH